MTQDVIALTPQMPDTRTLLAGLHAGGPDLLVNRAGDGSVAQLCTAAGQALVSLETPRYLQVPGEVARLLGPDVHAESPVWWTEARATSAVAGAGRLAGSVAGRVAAVHGGDVWPREAGHTDVVADLADVVTEATPMGVDLLTDEAAVVMQGRPVIAATTWLTDVVRNAARTGRELNLVTPPGTRLTFPTRTLLDGLPSRWVVSDPVCGYYDGLSGTVLQWNGERFAPAVGNGPRIADAFRPRPGTEGERQLLLSIRTVHPADEHLVLGGALEQAWRTFTGAPPAGWSTAEPVGVPWSPRQLTDLARTRAQQSLPAWVVAVGAPDHPAIATVRTVRTHLGVEEHITLALGLRADQDAPVDALTELAESLAARHRLATMISQLRTARADLTTPAHHEPPPVPLSFTLGSDAVADLAADRAAFAPLRLGPAGRPALHYALGDGTDPTAWQRLRQINDHVTAGTSKG
ncbi:hypothetical protein GCM10015535_66140 [Streptomyces gelaticus]|uniref:Uncharacterized protein n=1 Tax=Streptomyces gelaticus TaxID=285446 RepID=A0ABQ2WAG1_9ACTN|nr:DUF6177 family protein [Streptomyces gelaticus]GGV96499.1 hypothetical protein GCM10015535_66140 [Streptomyces gelaticus]